MSRCHRFVRRSKDRIKEFLCRRLHLEFNSTGLAVPLLEIGRRNHRERLPRPGYRG